MRLKILLTILFACLFVFLYFQYFVVSQHTIKQPTTVQPPREQILTPQVWKKIGHGISETEVTRIAFAPDNAHELLVSTSRAVYKSHGISGYLASLYLEGARHIVHDVYADARVRAVYVATDQGLYESKDGQNSWAKIYSSESGRSEECLSVLVWEEKIFLGTTIGLFVFDAQERRWKLTYSCFQDKPVFYLASDENYIYVGTSGEVYRFDPDEGQPKKIFSFIARETSQESNGEEQAVQSSIKDIVIFHLKESTNIYLVSDQGVLTSSDAGANWRAIPQDGIPWKDVTSAAACQDAFFVSSNNGMYRLANGSWQAMYRGAETQRFSYVACSPDDRVYAATDKGIFELVSGSGQTDTSFNKQELFQREFKNEPSIQAVHRMAINYAEVSPDKIRRWRHQLATKAFFPKLSIGVDGDRNRTTSDNVYGSYTSGGQSYVGPDDKTFYNNFGWDVSLSWDLGDLVWNSEETSIDNRSKLMVELREDILNETTRLYFERRRLQAQLVQVPESGAGSDLETQMRIDELTALIDALTGGEFSASIQKATQMDEI